MASSDANSDFFKSQYKNFLFRQLKAPVVDQILIVIVNEKTKEFIDDRL